MIYKREEKYFLHAFFVICNPLFVLLRKHSAYCYFQEQNYYN